MVANGQLSAGHARALLGSPDRGFQESMAAKVTADSLNVRQVEELVRAHLTAAENADSGEGESSDTSSIGETKPAGILELESILATHLDTRVKVTSGKGKGRMMVDFADLSDLERIFRVIMEGRPVID
jgi:ParB family chromosome partitioning protein